MTNDRKATLTGDAEPVTAVENKETARTELCKQIALWRVALAFGFVYDLDDVLAVLSSLPTSSSGSCAGSSHS